MFLSQLSIDTSCMLHLMNNDAQKLELGMNT